MSAGATLVTSGERHVGRRWSAGLTVALGLGVGACATAPPAPPASNVPAISVEQKIASALWLEDLRVLRDPNPPPPAPPPVPQGRRAVAAPLPPPVADLLALAADADARVRRRAALAIGRVGSKEGRTALEGLLKDADVDVRQMAAFGLGLLNDRAASAALIAALSADTSLLVRGRAAEALGLIDDTSAVQAVGDLVAKMAQSPVVAGVAPDEMGWPLAPEAEAFRLGLYALVRLKAYDAIAGGVLDAQGQPRIRWWPVAYALQRVGDARAVPALTALLPGPGAYTAAFAARGLAAHPSPATTELLIKALAAQPVRPAVRVHAIRGLGRSKDARAAAPLVALLGQPSLDPSTRLEVVEALGALRAAYGLRRPGRSGQRSVARDACGRPSLARARRSGRLRGRTVGPRYRH